LDIERYQEFLTNLPNRKEYTKSDLLVPDLLFAEEGKLRVFYAPFESVNENAKVVFLGITPGWKQMEIACREARTILSSGGSAEDACRMVKSKASFAGPLRTNLVKMLDAINLPHLLGTQSSSDLFDKDRALLHSTSVIRYPVFNGTKNYTGNNPRLVKSQFLMRFVKQILAPELESIPNAVIVPLGKSAEEVLTFLEGEKRIRSEYWLKGFPHPSGANGHRVRQFIENREKLTLQLKNILGKSNSASQE